MFVRFSSSRSHKTSGNVWISELRTHTHTYVSGIKMTGASFRSVRRRSVCCGSEQRHLSVPTLLSSRSGAVLTMRASVCSSDVLESPSYLFPVALKEAPVLPIEKESEVHVRIEYPWFILGGIDRDGRLGVKIHSLSLLHTHTLTQTLCVNTVHIPCIH